MASPGSPVVLVECCVQGPDHYQENGGREGHFCPDIS